MKINVTMFFLSELRRKNSKIAKRVLRWFQRNRWSVIILQAGIFWFDPIAIQPSHPLSSPSPSALNLSNESALHIRWPKYWSFSFSISPSNTQH